MTMARRRQQYSTQKSDAKRRGIPFHLTFDEWLEIWETSGHLAQRGNRAGKYVMARYGDRGGYELGNVRVILFEENAQEYRPTPATRGRIGAGHRGKFVSVKTRKKLSTRAKERPPASWESRMKMSLSQKQVPRARNEHGRFVCPEV